MEDAKKNKEASREGKTTLADILVLEIKCSKGLLYVYSLSVKCASDIILFGFYMNQNMA